MMRFIPRADEQRTTVLTAWATFLVPLSLAVFLGASTGESVSYYVGVTILSGLPVVAGVHEWIFEFAQWLERERKRRAEEARRAAILVARGDAFRATLDDLSSGELRLLCQAFNLRLRGLARDADSLEVTGLLARGLIYEERGYTSGGFPFYFTDEAWVLLNELPYDVFAARNRAAAASNRPEVDLPPMRPIVHRVPLWQRIVEFPPRLALTLVFGLVQATGFMIFGNAVAAIYMLLFAVAVLAICGAAWLVVQGAQSLLGML